MKRKIIFFFLLQTIWATGFSQSLSLHNLGEPFQCTNLVVHWNAPANALPSTVWIYRLLPRKFPPKAVSNLVASCGFTGKNIEISNADIVVYLSPGKLPARQLGISSAQGSIYYVSVSHYSPTNLAKDVPEMSQMLGLTTNFLSEFGINLSEIRKNPDGTPRFQFIQPFKEYFLPAQIVTNIEFREVGFGRSVEGANVLGAGTAGNGDIEFGEHSKPIKIDISWPDVKRYKSFPAASPEKIIQWIRDGKAVQCGIPMNLPPIDWQAVKSLTVKKAELCCYAGDRFAPSDWLVPLVSLWTTVDTGHGTTDVEIDCPLIDEAKP